MNTTVRLKMFLSFALTLCLCIGVSSCENESRETKSPTYNKSMLVGEWKAVEIETTFINGKESTVRAIRS